MDRDLAQALDGILSYQDRPQSHQFMNATEWTKACDAFDKAVTVRDKARAAGLID